MKTISARAILATLSLHVLAARGPAQQARDGQKPAPVKPTVDADGTVRIPELTVPYSSLATAGAKQNFLDVLAARNLGSPASTDIKTVRKTLDDSRMRPVVERLRKIFPVTITPLTIAGIQVDVIEPADGVAMRNRNRLLVNLHGGGFIVGARYGGQQESIPIASLGKFKVITVDYRMAPEHKFPAASEDVAAVYRALLKQYRPEDIGIYGCSAGGMLTAESAAWFQVDGLPRPGALGIFGAGAVIGKWGDSNFMSTALNVRPTPNLRDEDTKRVARVTISYPRRSTPTPD